MTRLSAHLCVNMVGAVQGEPPEKKPRQGAALVGTPSRVLVLRNMVGPGEVDEDLEEEVSTAGPLHARFVSV